MFVPRLVMKQLGTGGALATRDRRRFRWPQTFKCGCQGFSGLYSPVSSNVAGKYLRKEGFNVENQ